MLRRGLANRRGSPSGGRRQHGGSGPRNGVGVSEAILICYDDSPDPVRAIETAAALLGPRPAVVVNVLSWMTAAERIAATSSLVRGTAFEEVPAR
jgi:hypothetical protein